MAQARTPAQEIQASCDAIIRTSTITEADCDAFAAICVAREAALGDSVWAARGYNTALTTLNAVGVSIGLATSILE